MGTLKVVNPFNGKVVARLPADDAKSIATKYHRARDAQSSWSRTRVKQRLAVIARFREPPGRSVLAWRRSWPANLEAERLRGGRQGRPSDCVEAAKAFAAAAGHPEKAATAANPRAC